MTSSKHEGDILPTSVTKKKGNWVIKLSNESNAILRTPIEFTAGSNLIKFVCSHGGGCPFFSQATKSNSIPRDFLIFSYVPTTHLPVSIHLSIHSFVHRISANVCVCVHTWLWFAALYGWIVGHNCPQTNPITAPTHGTIISTYISNFCSPISNTKREEY